MVGKHPKSPKVLLLLAIVVSYVGYYLVGKEGWLWFFDMVTIDTATLPIAGLTNFLTILVLGGGILVSPLYLATFLSNLLYSRLTGLPYGHTFGKFNPCTCDKNEPRCHNVVIFREGGGYYVQTGNLFKCGKTRQMIKNVGSR